jgi:hypothetical protein
VGAYVIGFFGCLALLGLCLTMRADGRSSRSLFVLSAGDGRSHGCDGGFEIFNLLGNALINRVGCRRIRRARPPQVKIRCLSYSEGQEFDELLFE